MTINKARRSLVVIASLALIVPPVVASMPSTAWAQARKPIREQIPLEARGHWDAGIALAQRSKWKEARSSFQEAYNISKNPRILFNMAVAEKNQDHYAAAYELFKQELAEGKGQLAADEE